MVSYTSSDSWHQFFYICKHYDESAEKVHLVCGHLKSVFALAPDVIIVHRRESRWGGLSQSEEVFYRNVPHYLTPADTGILTTFFKAVAYHRPAEVAHSPILAHPDMRGLCEFNLIA
jgi:hypothetical protein